MAVIFDSLIYDWAIGILLLCICLYMYFTSTFNYWKDRGVRVASEPVPFVGNLKDQFLATRSICYIYQDIYDAAKDSRYVGVYEIRQPLLVITDPQLAELILVKDFVHFYDRGFPADPERDPLSANLFNLEGHTWRNLRYKLTPTFTTGKLKGMFDQIYNCAAGLIKNIEDELKINKELEGKPLVGNFTFKVISSVAFGLQLDSDNEENRKFQKTMEVLFKPTKIQMLKFVTITNFPKLSRRLGLKQFPAGVDEVVMPLISNTLKYRRDNNVNRNDFLQLMLNLQKQEKDGTVDFQKDLDYHPDDDVIDQMQYLSKGEEEENMQEKHKELLTEPVIAGQCAAFFSAGSESTSSTINFALFSLAQNLDIQKRVHDELDSILAHNNNQWSYHAIKEMVYLEQVIQETLRMYPIVPISFRVCTKPYKIPDSSVVIEKGVRVVIPVMAIQNDPRYYDNPQQFNPDRFQDNNFKPSSTYFPFGNGPRVCIAMRFAVLEVKMLLAKILWKYNVKLSPKTKLPLIFSKTSFLLAPENNFWFEFEKRV